MKTGIYQNIPDWKYHGDTEHISSSQVKYAHKDMNLFKAKVLDGLQTFDSPALKFGRAAHTLILEPEKFESSYLVFDDSADMRKKVNKEKKAEMVLKAKESKRELLVLSDYEKLIEMASQVSNYAPAAGLLEQPGDAEVSGYYERNGLKLKVRPDYLTKSNIIVDLKTSRDASLNSFTRDFKWNFNYDLSAAMYIDGMERITGEKFDYYFVVVEKEAPFSVAVYQLSAESKRFGEIKYQEALAKIAVCRDTRKYQLQNKIQEI